METNTKRVYQSLGIVVGSTFTNMTCWVCVAAQVCWFDGLVVGEYFYTLGVWVLSSREANYFTITW